MSTESDTELREYVRRLFTDTDPKTPLEENLCGPSTTDTQEQS